MNTITINSPKSQRSIDVEYNFGADLNEQLSLFGDALVFNKATTQMETDLGNSCRAAMNKGKTDIEIFAFVASYKPGVRAVGGPRRAKEDINSIYAKFMDPATTQEEKAALLPKLRLFVDTAKKIEKAVKSTA